MKYMLLIHKGTTCSLERPSGTRSSRTSNYLHATRAELLRRLDRVADARTAYTRAQELVHSDPERRFLERRLAELAD
jgi:predicted RNA polymerase sigma factor